MFIMCILFIHIVNTNILYSLYKFFLIVVLIVYEACIAKKIHITEFYVFYITKFMYYFRSYFDN